MSLLLLFRPTYGQSGGGQTGGGGQPVRKKYRPQIKAIPRYYPDTPESPLQVPEKKDPSIPKAAYVPLIDDEDIILLMFLN